MLNGKYKRMNRKGIYLIMGVLALLAAISLLTFTSSLSVFSPKHLTVGSFQLRLLDAELDFEQASLSLEYIGAQSAKDAILHWERRAGGSLNLPTDREYNRFILEDKGVVYYPSFIHTLEEFTPLLIEEMRPRIVAFNIINVGHNSDAAGKRPRYTIDAEQDYTVGYQDDHIIVVPAEQMTLAIPNPPLSSAFRRSAPSDNNDEQGIYRNTRALRIPLDARQRQTLYPYFSVLEQRNRAYGCILFSIDEGNFTGKEFCSRFSQLTIERTGLSTFALYDDKYIFHVIIGTGTSTNDHIAQFITVRDQIINLEQQRDGIRTNSNILRIPGSNTGLWLRFNTDHWQYRKDTGEWSDLYTINKTGLTTQQNIILEILGIHKDDFERGTSSIYDALKNYLPATSPFIIHLSNGHLQELTTDDIHHSRAILSMLSNEEFTRKQTQRAHVQSALLQKQQEMDNILNLPTSANIYIPELPSQDVATILSPLFFPIIESQYREFNTMLDSDNDGKTTINEALAAIEHMEQHKDESNEDDPYMTIFLVIQDQINILERLNTLFTEENS